MIVIGSDHGGVTLKDAIKGYLVQRGLAVDDLGTSDQTSVDYPDFGERVSRQVSTGSAELGILVCGTGIGMSIVANKFPGVRAALITDEFTARMAKEHNNANILVLGGRVVDVPEALRMVGLWLDSTFEAGRHQLRLDKIAQIEEDIRAGRI
ncbi:MAG: ribose 5-phosphate isomerase B [Trichloromonadaceae bacterium]